MGVVYICDSRPTTEPDMELGQRRVRLEDHSPEARLLWIFFPVLVALVLPPTAGVTHLKLLDDGTIVAPAETDVVTQANQQESNEGEYFIPSLQTTDPEFAVLLRHNSGLSKARTFAATGGGGGGGGGGAKERLTMRQHANAPGCPVVVTLNTQPANGQANGGQCVEKQFSPPRNPDGSGFM